MSNTASTSRGISTHLPPNPDTTNPAKRVIFRQVLQIPQITADLRPLCVSHRCVIGHREDLHIVHHDCDHLPPKKLNAPNHTDTASAIIGTALKICPLMTVDCEGELAPREKIRTKKRAISEMAKTMMAHVQGGADYSGKCIMSHSACREDAEAVAALIEEQVPQLKGKIEINDIGALIGSHTGPGTVALFFMGDKRVD